MVEKSHTAGQTAGGWYPSILGPLHGIKEHISEFFAPPADAAHTGEHYDINIELPGVSLEDIHIDVHDNTLSIHGEKKTEHEEKGRTYFFSERTYGAFQRSFRLPSDGDAEGITATFKDGVLVIRVPQVAAPPENRKRIEIGTG